MRRLTEATRRRDLLLFIAYENDKQEFPWAPWYNERRCRDLVSEGLLQVAGFSVMWGDLYSITPAGRAALAQSEDASRKGEG